jgi:hypothetical protein
MKYVLDRVRAVNPSHPSEPTDHDVASVVTEAIRRGQRPAGPHTWFSRRGLFLASSGVAAAVAAAVAVPALVLVTSPSAAVAAPLNQLAAEIEAASPPAPPKPYVYVRTRTEGIFMFTKDPANMKAVHDHPLTFVIKGDFQEAWLKLDGESMVVRASDGSFEGGCESDDGECRVNTGMWTPTPAWARSLPSDPTALRSLIRDKARGDEFDRIVLHLLQNPAMSPDVRAALIRLLPEVRDIEVLGPRTVNGHHGLGLATTYDGVRTEVVLERRTGVMLERVSRVDKAGQSHQGNPPGTELNRIEVLEFAYVDKPGATR